MLPALPVRQRTDRGSRDASLHQSRQLCQSLSRPMRSVIAVVASRRERSSCLRPGPGLGRKGGNVQRGNSGPMDLNVDVFGLFNQYLNISGTRGPLLSRHAGSPRKCCEMDLEYKVAWAGSSLKRTKSRCSQARFLHCHCPQRDEYRRSPGVMDRLVTAGSAFWVVSSLK